MKTRITISSDYHNVENNMYVTFENGKAELSQSQNRKLNGLIPCKLYDQQGEKICWEEKPGCEKNTFVLYYV